MLQPYLMNNLRYCLQLDFGKNQKWNIINMVKNLSLTDKNQFNGTLHNLLRHGVPKVLEINYFLTIL